MVRASWGLAVPLRDQRGQLGCLGGNLEPLGGLGRASGGWLGPLKGRLPKNDDGFFAYRRLPSFCLC